VYFIVTNSSCNFFSKLYNSSCYLSSLKWNWSSKSDAFAFLILLSFILLLYSTHLVFSVLRWKNCLAGCHTVSLWRFNVHLCVSMDSCIEPKRWRDSPWFYFCNFHVGFNVGKLTCIQIDGPLFTPSRELYANCFCSFFCCSDPPDFDHCMQLFQYTPLISP